MAASNHDRTFEKSVTLGNGTKYTSRGYGPALSVTGMGRVKTAGMILFNLR